MAHRLITDQALKVYRLCLNSETKARIARRRFQLEENRSRTTQMNLNNVIASPSPPPFHQFVQMPGAPPGLPNRQDISQIGAEQYNPDRLGE